MKAGLITGASSGIGLELAKIHASKGENVLLVARRKEKLLVLAEEIEAKFKVQALVFECDLGDENAVEELIESIASKGIFVNFLCVTFFPVLSDRNL